MIKVEKIQIIIEGYVEVEAENKEDARKKTKAWLKGIAAEENTKSESSELHIQIDESHWEG